MSLEFSIEDFRRLYCDMLMSKEEMIRQLNITDYIYKKIINDLSLIRSKTNKINRFKANNGIKINDIKNIEINKIDNNIAGACACETGEHECEVIKNTDNTDNMENRENRENTENILNKVKSTLQKSRRNRTIKKY
jgi:hypothetical protein